MVKIAGDSEWSRGKEEGGGVGCWVEVNMFRESLESWVRFEVSAFRVGVGS